MKIKTVLASIGFCLLMTTAQAQIKILKETKPEKNTTAELIQEKHTLPKEQLAALKKHYNWQKEAYLIVNYKGLANHCSYDIYDNLVAVYTHYEKPALAKLDLTNCRTLFVYADKLLAKPILDEKTHFEDEGHYFLKNFFGLDACNGVMVINAKGEYLFTNQEYSTQTIKQFLNNL